MKRFWRHIKVNWRLYKRFVREAPKTSTTEETAW